MHIHVFDCLTQTARYRQEAARTPLVSACHATICVFEYTPFRRALVTARSSKPPATSVPGSPFDKMHLNFSIPYMHIVQGMWYLIYVLILYLGRLVRNVPTGHWPLLSCLYFCKFNTRKMARVFYSSRCGIEQGRGVGCETIMQACEI